MNIVWEKKILPLTVFTNTCFSLFGSFSSTKIPWKIRPKVPMRKKINEIINNLHKIINTKLSSIINL